MLEEPTGRPTVAIGPSRGAAAKVFGTVFDDLVVTTYDDMTSEVDLTSAARLGLAVGPGFREALERLLTVTTEVRLLVEVPDEGSMRSWMVNALGSSPHLGIVGTILLPDGGTVLELGRAAPGAVSGAAVEVMVSAIPKRSSDDDGALWPKPAQIIENRRQARGDSARVPPRASSRAPAPPAVRKRLGRRASLLLLTVCVSIVVGALALILIGRSDLGADGVAVTVTLGLLAIQGVVLGVLAHVARGVRRLSRESNAFQREMSTRTARLLSLGLASRKRAVNQSKRLNALRKASEREQEHHEYVIELGRQLSQQIRDSRTGPDR